MAKFTVYEDMAPEVSKRLDKLAKKAVGYGVPFSYEVGEVHPATVRVLGSGIGGYQVEMGRHTVAAVDITVECEGFIKANGWTVCAKIEHGQNGNIVTGIGNHDIRPEWYTVGAHCDHCHTNRARSVTYICENEQGELRQVGRTCLKEYTGISPATAAMWAEVQDMIDRGMDCTTEEWGTWHPANMYPVCTVLAHACDVIREFGYRKSSESGSTRDTVHGRLLDGKEPSESGKAEAETLRDWLIGLDHIAKEEDAARKSAWEDAEANADEYGIPAPVKQTPNTVGDLERNCIPLALSGYAKQAHIGRLAYAPVAYRHYMERKEREERREQERQAASDASNYVGDVGQRLSFKVEEARLLSSWDGMYGKTWLYRFKDEDGNELIWYASKLCEARNGSTIKATVKDHKERDGVKQTIITRCKVAG